jgi:hypothetical protein
MDYRVGYGKDPELARQRLHRLLQWQTVLVMAFILLSLGLWVGQTYRPELSRLQTLAQYGTQRAFDLNVLELRNWYPLGHQNYVAGFLVLNLPLVVGWGCSQRRTWRMALLGRDSARPSRSLHDRFPSGRGRLGALGMLAALSAAGTTATAQALAMGGGDRGRGIDYRPTDLGK